MKRFGTGALKVLGVGVLLGLVDRSGILPPLWKDAAPEPYGLRLLVAALGLAVVGAVVILSRVATLRDHERRASLVAAGEMRAATLADVAPPLRMLPSWWAALPLWAVMPDGSLLALGVLTWLAVLTHDQVAPLIHTDPLRVTWWELRSRARAAFSR